MTMVGPRRLILHERHKQSGAEFRTIGGMEVPARFSSSESEYEAAVKSCALIDLSHFGKTIFSGPDRQTFLNGLLTNDVKTLPVGGGLWTCLLTHKGKLVADFALYNPGDSLVAVHFPQTGTLIQQGLAKYLPLSDTTVEDASEKLGAFYLRGPKAEAVIRDVFQKNVGATLIERTEFSSSPLWLCRFPLDAKDGFLLLFPSERSNDLWDAISQKGEPQGLRPAGYDLFETLRIEAGWPELGVDMDSDTFPAVAGLEKAINYTKGCYLGQETTTRLKTQGRPKDKLVGLKVGGPVRPSDRVAGEGNLQGKVTSVTNSPAAGGVLALATVPFAASVPGTQLKVLSAEMEQPAEVIELPLRRPS